MTNNTPRKPDFNAYVVIGEGERANWTKIGAAWSHRQGGGYNIDLDALPVNGRIVLTVPKAKEDEQEEKPAERRTRNPKAPRK